MRRAINAGSNVRSPQAEDDGRDEEAAARAGHEILLRERADEPRGAPGQTEPDLQPQPPVAA